ncbi:MAG: acyl-CoA dehydrogenase family protein [Gammaproteobacteria bacterium]|nr:acyl-CoA dehydrogenase family protein [Gammaproteobacteria bacterium]
MDFSFTEEQQMLKDSVDRFVQNEYDFDARQKLAATDPGYSEAHWQTFAELGWLGITFAESVGGYGGSAVDSAIILEAFGRGLVLEPFLASVVLGGNLLARAGSAEQQAACLPQVIEGQKKLALAYFEPEARYELSHVTTRAEFVDGGYLITGRKGVVLHGATADWLIVSARTAGGPRDVAGVSLFLVDAATAGVETRPYRMVDGLMGAELGLSRVRVGSDALIGELDLGLEVLEWALDYGIAGVCAEAVGCMDRLQELTLEYMKTRQQFGVALGSFQVVQHRMAEMFMACEQARSLAYMAAVKVDSAPQERRRALSAAKVYIGQAGRLLGQESVQLHGGIGCTDELNVPHYFKRLTAINAWFGDESYHLGRFAGTE